MKPDDFAATKFEAEEVDCAWHVYAALLLYSMRQPEAMENPRFVRAVSQQKFMFDQLFERLET